MSDYKTINVITRNFDPLQPCSWFYAEPHSEPCQTSKMEGFAKIFNGFWSLTIFAKRSVLDPWQGSEYVFARINLRAGVSQPIFTCSNLTIETLEQGVEYDQYI